MESAPDGGRRRVLRPWGMRRTAPPTISPDMLDLAPAGIPGGCTRVDPAVRFDFWIAGGLVVALVGALWINGKGRPGRDGTHDANAPVAAGTPVYVAATAPPIVQEARLEGPPLIDVSSATPPAAATRRVTASAPVPARGKTDGATAIPAVIATPSRESSIDDRRGEVSAPPVAQVPSMPLPVSDRWQPLRSALAQCGSVDGAIARAMCEQEARLAHCDGYWGLVALCPTNRSEFGQ